MAPSIMTKMETPAYEESSISHQNTQNIASTSTSQEASSKVLPSSSSTISMDLPELLDECVKDTFLLGFSSAVIHSAIRDLSTIREAVLGVDRIKSLITEGCTPEQIGYMIASKQELLDGFKSVEGDVRDLALGYTVVQVSAQFEAAGVSDEPSLDSTRLRRFQKMNQDMRADPPKKVVEFPKIDYTSLQSFILDEKANGVLVGDPAWEDLKKKHKSWKLRLQSSLESLNRNFREAAEEIDWTTTSSMDTDLLQALPSSTLIKLLLDNHDKATVRLSSGPILQGKTESIVDAQNLSTLGRDFRSDVLDYCKRMANDKFKSGQYEEADRLYGLALRAGSNDATVTINRAAALLKIEKFEEAQRCCTIGLVQLDIAKDLSVGASKTKAEDAVKLVPSLRSKPMLASQETVSELRWKALIRRGRANKGKLMQLGGLSVSGLPYLKAGDNIENYLEEEFDDDEEHRRATERGRLLLAARSDFAAALRLDPLEDIPRQEMASLTIDPLQRRPSGTDIRDGLALASISQLNQERKRSSQEVGIPAKPRRSESS